ncbi:MAG TPA: HAMP domain-containing histidine kinase, partial [Thermotogales bacterium]|nr:HAMP domain-containing histidine kinase [Thermotogales bacterium]
DDIPHVTDRFYRVHRDVDGMGIGLSIVKEVVEFHGGELNIKSRVNGGTTVEMIFKKSDVWRG